jgi:beta-lactamase regulating signal transducer with metallopeptidase domain
MSGFHLLEYVVRVTLCFGIGWVLSTVFKLNVIARKRMWLVCFVTPLLLLLPLPSVRLAVLGEGTAAPSQPLQLSPSSQLQPTVYEQLPSFSTASPTYIDAPVVPLIGWLLLSLTLVGWTLLALRIICTQKIVRESEQIADESLLDLLYELAAKHSIHEFPPLVRSDQISSPCIWGVSQPVILIPAKLKPSKSEWSLILEHELLHLKHRDPLVLLSTAIVNYGLWWNPLVAVAFRDLHLAQEQAVDQAMKHLPGYASIIARGAQESSDEKRPTRPALLVFEFPRIGSFKLSNLNLKALQVGLLTGETEGGGELKSRLQSLQSARTQRGFTALQVIGMLTGMAAIVPTLLPLKVVTKPTMNLSVIGLAETVYVAEVKETPVLMRVGLHGEQPTQMPPLFTKVSAPSVSPDGTWLAYTRKESDEEDIYIAKVDGSEERKLVGTVARDIQPRWSPDGKLLVFSTLVTGSWEIAAVECSTGRWWMVTNDGKKNLEAAFHPNGKRIVFSSLRNGYQKLWSMNLDGTGLTQLTFGHWEDTHGRFNQDGSLLAYAANRRAKFESTVLNLKTGEARTLAQLHQLESGEVEFAPDGSLLMTSQDGIKPSIVRVDLKTGERHSLTSVAPSIWPACR